MAVKVIRQLSPASPGTQNYTVSGFGTPQAVLVFATYASSDGTVADHAGFSIGAADGTSQWVGSKRDAHGVADTDCMLTLHTNAVVHLPAKTTAALELVADFDAWITDGVRLDFTTTTVQALITVVLINEATNVKAGTFTTAADTAATTVNVGFDSDLILTCFTQKVADAALAEGGGPMSFGAIWNGASLVQRCTNYFSQNAAASGDPRTVVRNDAFAGTGSATTISAGNFTATGFDATTNGSFITGQGVGYLALELTGWDIWLGSINPPAATGDSDVTAPGFEPEFCFETLSYCAAENTAEVDADAGPFGISVSDGTTSICNTNAIEDASLTTDTQSVSDDAYINLDYHDGSALYDASFSSFLSNGWRRNFSVTGTLTTRAWWGLALLPSAVTTAPADLAPRYTAAPRLHEYFRDCDLWLEVD